MKKYKKVLLLVLDSAGCGAMDDAKAWGDSGANTILHCLKPETKLPNLQAAGLFNIDTLKNEYITPVQNPAASYGKMLELSAGKDTTTGHFELAGAIVEKPYPTYPNGIPEKIINDFEKIIGLETIGGGLPASGTEIIERLGDESADRGCPIVYTSADSVFQIACSEDTFGLENLYQICQAARAMLTGDRNIARVIARPFKRNSDGKLYRTVNRRDYSVLPPSKTILSELLEAGLDVTGVGKIGDIFSMQGITESYHTHTNTEGIKQTLELLDRDYHGLIFTNLVDFDMLYGHRRDKAGYLAALEEFDRVLPELVRDDVLTIITADHGCDPTHSGTDHTREYVPLLVFGSGSENLGTINGFNKVAEIIEEVLLNKIN